MEFLKNRLHFLVLHFLKHFKMLNFFPIEGLQSRGRWQIEKIVAPPLYKILEIWFRSPSHLMSVCTCHFIHDEIRRFQFRNSEMAPENCQGKPEQRQVQIFLQNIKPETFRNQSLNGPRNNLWHLASATIGESNEESIWQGIGKSK